MKLPVVDLRSGKNVGSFTVSDEVFGAPMNPALVAQAVHVYRSNSRQASASVLTRGEVYGSRRKLWKQKGTGRARHGDRFAPQFVGGGVAHGPTGDQNYTRTMNDKMRRKALFIALTTAQQNGTLVVLDSFGTHTKTASIAKALTLFSKNRNVLCVVEALDEKMKRATRNLEDVTFITPEALNAILVLSADKIIISQDAVKRLENHFLQKTSRRSL